MVAGANLTTARGFFSPRLYQLSYLAAVDGGRVLDRPAGAVKHRRPNSLILELLRRGRGAGESPSRLVSFPHSLVRGSRTPPWNTSVRSHCRCNMPECAPSSRMPTLSALTPTFRTTISGTKTNTNGESMPIHIHCSKRTLLASVTALILSAALSNERAGPSRAPCPQV